MDREILILRHAKSDWGSPSLADKDRPLNKRGEAAALQMGRWMKKQNLAVDKILSSPALRARQTIERVCQAMQLSQPQVSWEPRLYLASVETLVDLLQTELERAVRVLVVGHNPGLEDLLVYLCGNELLPRTDSGKLLTTANLAQVILKADSKPLGAGVGHLRHLWRPREIDKE